MSSSSYFSHSDILLLPLRRSPCSFFPTPVNGCISSFPLPTYAGQLVISWPCLLAVIWPTSATPHFSKMWKMSIHLELNAPNLCEDKGHPGFVNCSILSTCHIVGDQCLDVQKCSSECEIVLESGKSRWVDWQTSETYPQVGKKPWSFCIQHLNDRHHSPTSCWHRLVPLVHYLSTFQFYFLNTIVNMMSLEKASHGLGAFFFFFLMN